MYFLLYILGTSFVLTPLWWGLRFMPAGAALQVSRSPAQDPGYQLKSSLASELLSVYLSHIICISVCMILLLVLEVCGQSVYMGPIRNSVYALWILLNMRLCHLFVHSDYLLCLLGGRTAAVTLSARDISYYVYDLLCWLAVIFPISGG